MGKKNNVWGLGMLYRIYQQTSLGQMVKDLKCWEVWLLFCGQLRAMAIFKQERDRA